MLISSRPFRILKPIRIIPSLETASRCRMSRSHAVAASGLLAITAMLGQSSRAQGVFSPPQTTTQSPSTPGPGLGATEQSQSDGSQDDKSSSSSTLAVPATLSSNQIIHILQQNPDLVVELKSQVADHLQQQGTPIDANDISDQMLYSQIATNGDLRANITMFLRARGYVSQDDLQSLGSNSNIGTAEGSDLTGQESTGLSGQSPALAGSDTARLAAADLSSPDQIEASGRAAQLVGSAANQSSNEPMRGREPVNGSTDPPKVLRQPAPYNLQSMRDLYTQIPEQTLPLKRFGSDVFVNRNVSAMARGGAGRDTPLDVPLGPDYVIGAGDTLTINMWGGMTQSVNRVIDRDGRILLPEAGSLDLAGLSLDRAESLIDSALKKQYRDVKVTVTVSRLRSVRVYVVGDVQRPGGYDISSLATPLSALYLAGGPTAAGSLRMVRHLRGEQLVENIDLYDFLLHGVRAKGARFESGDTLLISPIGPQVAVAGAVKRPAIYELKPGESTLDLAISDAGGLTAAASLGNITIERIDINRQRETVTLKTSATGAADADRATIAAFQIRDGDRIRIAPILPYSQRAIYLEGHVVRPGRRSYSDGMRLSDVLHSYQDLLPEPSPVGEIIRLVPPDLHAETINFNVPNVLIGNSNLDLQTFDTIRILGRYQADAPKVTIQGEVLRPSTYPLSDGMTAAQLVRMAGGFKRDAMLDEADLTSYGVANGTRVTGNLVTVHIGTAVAGTEPKADVLLKPGDILTIHQITGWNEIGQSVQIEGQVAYPGTYGFREGERLSSVLRRAGGFRETAYPAGAVLVRDQVRELEQKSREELIRQIETSSASARLSPNLGAGDSGATLKLIQAQQDQVLARLKSEPPTGRLVVHISSDIDIWANTSIDIEMRRGDVLTIPKRPGFVLITGQVYNATALTFAPGKTASWYLQHAGGTSDTANRREIFVIRANGSVIGRHSGGLFDPSVLSTKLGPGDVVVVPQKVIGASLFWKNLLTAAQLASSIAITAAVANI
ncbi:SLBB domain-containing protein [Tunturiibacter empetritectus]|uniref:Protein involved in polysaccharide export with SLBB domain n=1 Tax=Tunturiibacter lichenicola TaxID=2051959 RepID=A0A852VBZ1_9BACT|nr:SLBB domain-containing protein [Edaphobacter lichenicola]NYF88359.1 protein involved in polysaccharide export with SLBB domain [Edaphobacter lichenicola]